MAVRCESLSSFWPEYTQKGVGDPNPLPMDMHVRAGVGGIPPETSRLRMVRQVELQRWKALGMSSQWSRNKCKDRRVLKTSDRLLCDVIRDL